MGPMSSDFYIHVGNFLQPDSNHPRDVLPFLCRRFYYMGWMSGTGGALSMKQGYVSLVTSSQ